MTEENNQQAQPDAAQSPADSDQDRTAGQDEEALVNMTQAQLSALLAREKRQARLSERKDIGDVEELKAKAAKLDEIEAANMSEMEKMQQQMADMQKQLLAKEEEATQAQRTAQRVRVGAEMGLPAKLAERLTGDDEEAMKADAQALLDSLKGLAGQGTNSPPDIDATAGGEQRAKGKTRQLPPAIQNMVKRGLITEDSYWAAQDAMEGKS